MPYKSPSLPFYHFYIDRILSKMPSAGRSDLLLLPSARLAWPLFANLRIEFLGWNSLS
jgi:hypothetical protein